MAEIDGSITITYPEPRPLDARVKRHPLGEDGWRAVAETQLDGQTDTVLLERDGRHRMIELYDEYGWCAGRRELAWREFLEDETESGDRDGWTRSIGEKLAAYGQVVAEPRVWVGRNEAIGGDWLLALEF